MAAVDDTDWRRAHPPVTVSADAGDAVATGPYSALMFLHRLPEDHRIHGYVRCPTCGITAVTVHRVVRVNRADYAVVGVRVVDYLYPLGGGLEPPAGLRPDPDIRGDSLAIEFRCEYEHEWMLELGNHKGTTIASLSDGSGSVSE